jgi:drug/metabolite transporter (DMT)-like permease
VRSERSHRPLLDHVSLVVVALLLFDSLHFVFARLLLPHLPPATSAMYVLGIATVQLGVVAVLQGSIRWDLARRHLWFFVVIGLLVALSTNMNYASVAFIDPGTASVLSKTTILFGLALGLVWLRERLTAFQIAGTVIAIAGVVIVTFHPGDYLRLGSLIVLGSTLLYAVHTAIVKRFGSQMDMTNFLLFRLASTSGFLFLLSAGQGDLIWPDLRVWGLLLLVGTVDVVISRALYYLALRRLTMSLHSIILTLSPVAAILWSLALFGISPTAQQFAGGVIIIAGIIVVTVGQSYVVRARTTKSIP